MFKIWEAEDIPTADLHHSFHKQVLVHPFISSPSPTANCSPPLDFSAILLSRRNKSTLRNNVYCTVWQAVLLCGLGFFQHPHLLWLLRGSRSCTTTDGQLAGKQPLLQGKPQALSFIFLKKQLCTKVYHCTPTLAMYTEGHVLPKSQYVCTAEPSSQQQKHAPSQTSSSTRDAHIHQQR